MIDFQHPKMKICFLSGEIFAWGKYGGFGFLTRKIGGELARSGVVVYAIVPLGKGQKPVETLDGITVFGFPGGNWRALEEMLETCDADIYHSEEPTLATYLAQKIHPDKKHIVTFQDPRTIRDLFIDFRYRSLKHKIVFPRMLYFESAYNPRIRRAVHQADQLFSQAKFVIEKCKELYKLKEAPRFLPNPIDVPTRRMQKADKPTVCFLGRWAGVKRPKIFLDLAAKFPKVDFLMMGGPVVSISKNYAGLENLKLLGLSYNEEKSAILEKSWALVNTSAKECLPVSYLEAAAHNCVIISSIDADSFASRFGFHVDNDNYTRAIEKLLEGGWEEKGGAGHEYVKEVHETRKVINLHRSIYKRLLE